MDTKNKIDVVDIILTTLATHETKLVEIVQKMNPLYSRPPEAPAHDRRNNIDVLDLIIMRLSDHERILDDVIYEMEKVHPPTPDLPDLDLDDYR